MMQLVLASEQWPDKYDLAILGGYLLVIVGLPLAGYMLFVVDVRAHYRRLRGALVAISQYTARVPAWVAKEYWARAKTPPCIAAFDLELPCTETELLEAYRSKVKKMHPDLGGDPAEFLTLQQHFEHAQSLLEGMSERTEP